MPSSLRALAGRIDVVVRDLVQARRRLLRAPAVPVTVIVSLALGVGANAAVFTALDRLFFAPPAGVKNPAALRRLYAHNYSREEPWLGADGGTSPFLSARDLAELSKVVDDRATLVGDYLYRRGRLEDGQSVMTDFVTPGFFELLGVSTGQGRGFRAADHQRGTEPVAIVSDRFWRQRLGGDPGVLGRAVAVDGTRYRIVGIGPGRFEGLEVGGVDLWAPSVNMMGGEIGTLRVVARLKPGTDRNVLDQVLTERYRRMHEGDPLVEPRSSILSGPLLESRGPAVSERGRVPGMSERSLQLLPRLGAVGLVVFLMAVANAASLLLMRAVRDRRELAVRVALGGSRWDLVRRDLVEAIGLALVAGAVALMVAAVAGAVLREQLGDVRWPEDVLTGRVYLLAAATALGAALAAVVPPVLYAWQSDVGTLLRTSERHSTSATRVRTGLLIAQAAVCMTLLACAGAFLRSLFRAVDVDRGYDPSRAFVLSVPSFYAGADAEVDAIAQRLRSLPTVEAVGRSQTGLSGAVGLSAMIGRTTADTIGIGPRGPSIEFVEPEFIRAAGLEVVAGRPFSASDNAPVAVVSEAVARALWRGGSPLGSCVYVRQAMASPCRTVVGIVRDFRSRVDDEPIYRVYLPRAQAWIQPDRSLIPNFLVVRMSRPIARGDAAALRDAAAPLLSGGITDLTVLRADAMIDRELRPWRLAAVLLLIMGGLGLAAATAGIYGLVSYDVSQRQREWGIRLALGASPAAILRQVTKSGLRVTSVGLGIGGAAALAAGRGISGLLFETTPYDPVVLAVSAGVIGMTAALASVLPAMSACRIDPIRSLSE